MKASTPHSKPSFGPLFLATTLTLSGVLVFLGFRGLAASRESAIRLAETQSQNLARAIDQNLGATLKRVDHTLLTVSLQIEKNLATGNLNPAQLKSFIATEEKLLPEAVAIRVTNADGTVIINNPSKDPSANFRDHPFFPWLREHPNAGMYVTKPILGLFAQQWVITSARSYRLPDGRFGGVVVVPVSLEHFQKSLSGFEVGPSGMLTLRDSEGGFVARHPHEVKGKRLAIGDRTISRELRLIFDSGVPQQTYLATAPFDQTKRTLTFRRIEGFPLCVVAGLAEEDYLAQWRRDRIKTLAMITACLLGGWTLAGLLWKSWVAREHDTKAMLASKEQFRVYVEQSIDVIFTLDAQGAFHFVSPAWERQFGYSAHEVIGKLFAPFVHPDDVQPCAEYLNIVLSTGESRTSPPYRVRHRDSSWRWFMANGSRISAADGKPLFMGVAHDITERRRADEALKESEERLRVIFEASEAGIILVSPQGELRFANRRMAEMFGMSLQELIGTAYTEHLHESEKQIGDERMRQLIAGELQLVALERRYIRRDGSEFWGHLSGRRLENPDGSLRALVGVITDITEQKRVEEERHVLLTKLHQAQKMDSLGSLAGGVAHDMNNVLGAILGLASIHLEIQPPDSPAYRAFDTIAKAATRGGQMVKSLLSFARQSPVEERELDLNAILLEEVHLLEHTTLSKVSLQLELAPGLRLMRGDASALTHALMNLCVNAVDAMPENGTLTFRTFNRKGGWIEVQVEDTGVGMPKEILDKALDPFFTTKEHGKGTGLGLSVVYSTVKAHQGQMEIESEPGKGTLVKIRFPACEVEAEASRSSAEHAPKGLQRPLTVLLVDDDELIQSAIQALLESLGHRAHVISSGEEALEKFEAGFQADLVILDMNMPGIGGGETLLRLRRLRPTIPVILATGRPDQTVLDLVNAHAFVTLLPKPFGMKELRPQLDAIERR